MSDDRQYAPATLRNRDFILDILRDVLRRARRPFREEFPGSRFPTFGS